MKPPLKKYLQKNDDSKLTQYLAVLAGTIAVLTAATHGGWPNPSLSKIMGPNYPHDVSPDEASYIAISGPFGDIIGGISASLLVDFLGRKKTLLCICVPQILSHTLFYFSYFSKYLLYLGRICGGIGQGAVLATLPQYIGEVTEPSIRGKLGTLVSVSYNFGMLIINFVGSFFDVYQTALICLIFPIIFFLTFINMPESPYYLLRNNREEEARESLKILRRKHDVEKELKSLSFDVKRQMSESGTFKDLFVIESNRKAVIFAGLARIFQQFSGSNAFATYYQIIIADSTNISPVIGSSAIIIMQLVAGLGSSFLVDKYGRKILFIFSSGTCFLTLLAQALYFTIRDYTELDVSQITWLPLIILILFIIFHQCGLGVVVNIYISEIFSTSIKSKALIVLTIVFGTSMITSTKFYQYTNDHFGAAVPVYSFATIEFVGMLYFIFVLPETKGKTLEQIQQELKGNKIQCIEETHCGGKRKSGSVVAESNANVA